MYKYIIEGKGVQNYYNNLKEEQFRTRNRRVET